MRLILLGAVCAAALSACERHVTEADVFIPHYAPNLTLTVSDETGVLIKDNVPRAGLFEDVGISLESGVAQTAFGEIVYEIARSPEAAPPLLVNCHGNAGTNEHHGPLTIWKLHDFGDVVIWDYPGYGASDGEATVSEMAEAVAAMAARLPEMKRAPDQPVVFWGYSFGGFMCARLAAASGMADAVVFEASALSAETAVGELVPFYAKPFIRPKLDQALRNFDNAEALSGLDAPILILAGGKDDVLPPRQSERLRDALQVKGLDVTYRMFAQANHYTISFKDEFEPVVDAFLIEAGIQGGGP